MALLDLRGGYLYQVRPDLFPEGYLTILEQELWGIYYDEKSKER